MPKETFFNLNSEKRNAIIETLHEEFTSKPFQQATVKSIVEKLQIPRGSFYQYFESLQDSYFYLLSETTLDIHLLFIKSFEENNGDISLALYDFGKKVSNELFDPRTYELYKNKYLCWNAELEKNWLEYCKHSEQVFYRKKNNLNKELVFFIKAIVHDLIERNFKEGWTKIKFQKIYTIHTTWIKEGVLQ